MHDFSLGPDKEIRARFTFPADFLGFQGHFPGKPVLPGVCKIQAVLCMLEKSSSKHPRLKEVCLAKFFAPATHDEELSFTVRQVSEGNGEVNVKALISHKDKKIAEIRLRVGFQD